jgi:hypothetical protein
MTQKALRKLFYLFTKNNLTDKEKIEFIAQKKNFDVTDEDLQNAINAVNNNYKFAPIPLAINIILKKGNEKQKLAIMFIIIIIAIGCVFGKE